MPQMRELKTEIEAPRLTVDERPRLLPLVRMQGRWRLDAFGRYWTSGELLVLGLGALAAAALWAWLGR